MNDLEIHDLFSYGKAVRQGTIKLHDAVKQIHQKYNDVAEKSAEYYIRLYSQLIEGKTPTFNANNSVLLYYVENIYQEEGKQAGENAFKAVAVIARTKTTPTLQNDLNSLMDKLRGITWWPPISEYDPGLSAEDYKKYLMEIVQEKSLAILDTVYGIFKFGGAATCRQLQDRYHKPASHYNSNGRIVAKAIAEKSGCKVWLCHNKWLIFDEK